MPVSTTPSSSRACVGLADELAGRNGDVDGAVGRVADDADREVPEDREADCVRERDRRRDGYCPDLVALDAAVAALAGLSTRLPSRPFGSVLILAGDHHHAPQVSNVSQLCGDPRPCTVAMLDAATRLGERGRRVKVLVVGEVR